MAPERSGADELERTLSEGLDSSDLTPNLLSSEVYTSENTITVKIRVRDNAPSAKDKKLDIDGIFRDAVGREIFVLKGWVGRHGDKLFEITQYANVEQRGYDTYEITVTFIRGNPTISTIPLIEPSLN